MERDDSNTDSVPKLIEDDNSDMAIQLPESNFLQLHRKYIITQVKSGLMIIDQQRAHERIMYERYLELLSKRVTISQQVLFESKYRFRQEIPNCSTRLWKI